MSQDFGSYLKHERELRGVPLDDIAQSTKISIRFLRALEDIERGWCHQRYSGRAPEMLLHQTGGL
jgi:hypothetical protein